ncbi:MAG: sugar phosphate isomerase/epimerase [Planctomycetaceae bacterium]|nr:sugar phosphate isomerase/epimerase [Planctomycetaceae bacterium]
MKIGVMVESFREGLDGGLYAAADIGAQGVQMYATAGETHPRTLKGTRRRDLLKKTQDLGLEFAAICGDFGGHGFEIAQDNARRVDDSRRVAELALDLSCRVVTTHIGVLPTVGMPRPDREPDRKNPRWGVMLDACRKLAAAGKDMGATFAIETGPEPAAVLKSFLDEVAVGGGISVNFDPANLAMVIAEDIPAATTTLGPYIVHTHAKDGLNLKPCDAEALYGAFAEAGIAAFDVSEFIREVPLGQGAVPWAAYLAALKAAKYDYYLTVEREVGREPRTDIELAVKFLTDLLKNS